MGVVGITLVELSFVVHRNFVIMTEEVCNSLYVGDIDCLLWRGNIILTILDEVAIGFFGSSTRVQENNVRG